MTTNEELIAELREVAGVNPLDVTCGECGSKPGKRCYGNGEMRRTHSSRASKAEHDLRAVAADALEAATRERDAALAAVEVTRKLHHKITRYGNDYYSISAESYEDDPSSYDDLEPFDLCAECYEVERLICEECGGDAPIGHRSSWPCPTVAALDGAPDNESLPNHCQECGAWGTVEVHLRGCSLDGAPEPEVKP